MFNQQAFYNWMFDDVMNETLEDDWEANKQFRKQKNQVYHFKQNFEKNAQTLSFILKAKHWIKPDKKMKTHQSPFLASRKLKNHINFEDY